jgi:hypothetical protein
MNWKTSQNLTAIRPAFSWVELTDEIRQDWLQIEGLVKAAGRRREAIVQRRDELFGEGNWRQGWSYRGEVIGWEQAVQLYEDAYLELIRSKPWLLGWICRAASDVYDNDVSNVDSGLDYALQETQATHLQDIAVRRAVVRLGRALQGDHLVEIHGHLTEGARLSPGVVPFHEQQEILPCAKDDWWEPQSVEAFWQHNKLLLVNPESIRLLPIAAGAEGLWCRLFDAVTVLLPLNGELRLRTSSRNEVSALHSPNRKDRAWTKITYGWWMSYAELVACPWSNGEDTSRAEQLAAVSLFK